MQKAVRVDKMGFLGLMMNLEKTEFMSLDFGDCGVCGLIWRVCT